MKVGDTVTHRLTNERMMVAKLGEGVAVCLRVELPKERQRMIICYLSVWYMNYPIAICALENLSQIGQLKIFQ